MSNNRRVPFVFNEDAIMDGSIKFIIVMVTIFKALLALVGTALANVADVTMGMITITLLFGGFNNYIFGIPAWMIGGSLSAAASAFQIFLMQVMKREKISFWDVLTFWILPNKSKNLVLSTGVIWALDTFLDVAAVPVLVSASAFSAYPTLNIAVKVAVMIMVFIICGFSESMTTQLKDVLVPDFDESANNVFDESANNVRRRTAQTSNQNNLGNRYRPVGAVSHTQNNTPRPIQQNPRPAPMPNFGGGSASTNPARNPVSLNRPQGVNEPTYHSIGMKDK